MAFSIAFVPGVTITKWTRIWEERRPETPLAFEPVTTAEQATVLHAGRADVGFVRLPVEREGLSVIRLYDEVAVVVLPVDHELAKREELSLADLAGLTLHPESADVAATVELIAAGVGAAVLPHAIARQNSRKDVVARPVTDAEQTQIAIAWLEENTTDDIEEFVGIVRGRSAQSSRGVPTPPTEKPQRKPSQKPATKNTRKVVPRRRRQGR